MEVGKRCSEGVGEERVVLEMIQFFHYKEKVTGAEDDCWICFHTEAEKYINQAKDE